MAWERKPSQRVMGGFQAARMLEGGHELPPEMVKALRVARRMDMTAKLDWADSSLSVIGRNVSEHRRHPETGDFLRAALSDAVALYAVLAEAVEALPPPVGLPPVEARPTASLGVASLRQG